MKMHEGQVEIDVELVRTLLADQQPELSKLSIEPVSSMGSVNALFRIGGELCARLPLLEKWADSIELEWDLIHRLRREIRALQLPDPIFRGRPSHEYPLDWAIYRWIEGDIYGEGAIDDEVAAARTLAGFVRELHSIPVDPSAPKGGRDPLAELDEETREAILTSEGEIDAEAAMAIWERSLEAPAWDGAPAWIHGDLLRPNLIAREGRLVAVIDWGGAGVGDPATDVIPAWSVFGQAGRDEFRSALGVDDGMWARARGIELHQAVMLIPYYRQTNPRFAEEGKRIVAEIIRDSGG